MPAHRALTFALDIADKLIKLAAVILGGIWTWWNYRKSRTYAQKLELEITASILVRAQTYVEITITLKNLGAHGPQTSARRQFLLDLRRRRKPDRAHRRRASCVPS